MASLLQLNSRIKAAQNVSKTTKALQMIAASNLKRAQHAAFSSRPYVAKLDALTKSVAEKVEQKQAFAYLEQRLSSGKSLVIFLTPDKGLCGGLIANLLREFIRNVKNENNMYILVGKKAETYVTKLEKNVIASFKFGTTVPSFDMVYPIIKLIEQHYLSGNVDSVKILGAHFVSIFTQTPKVDTILPIKLNLSEGDIKKQEASYLFEPNASDLLPSLLKQYLEMTIYQHLLESFVSEQGARMIAMQNATTNARDLIEDYKLEYNKTRQTKITNEILDITSTRIAR